MPTTANITVEDLAGYPSAKVIRVVGELDESNLSDLENTVNPLIQNPDAQVIILNFSGLEFMSSKIIGYLAGLYTNLSHENKKMILTEFNQTIFDILSLVGMDQMVGCYGTMNDAIASISND